MGPRGKEEGGGRGGFLKFSLPNLKMLCFEPVSLKWPISAGHTKDLCIGDLHSVCKVQTIAMQSTLYWKWLMCGRKNGQDPSLQDILL